MFSHKLFTSYADHPRQVICAGICSSAAGRYQFLDKTWDGVRKNQGFKDFTPPNQDKGGLYLARQRGVTNYDQRLSKSAFDTSIRKLGREWASLPGSPYGQPIKSMKELWKVHGLCKVDNVNGYEVSRASSWGRLRTDRRIAW